MRAVLVEARRYLWWSATPGSFLGAGGAALLVAWRSGATGLAGTTVAALVALGAATSFDDPLATVLASSPTSLRVRTAGRAVVVAGLALAFWTGAVALARLGDRDVRLLALEPLTLTFVVVAASVRGMAQPVATRGAVGAAALLVCLAVVLQLPAPLAFYPEEAHRVTWFGLLAVAVAAIWQLTRDPLDGRTAAARRRDA